MNDGCVWMQQMLIKTIECTPNNWFAAIVLPWKRRMAMFNEHFGGKRISWDADEEWESETMIYFEYWFCSKGRLQIEMRIILLIYCWDNNGNMKLSCFITK